MKLAHAAVVGAGLEVNAWASSEGIVAVRLGLVPAAGKSGGRPVEGVTVEPGTTEALSALADALPEYLGGEPLAWDGPLDLRGVTPFQRDVFEVVRAIPHGETRSYGDVAAELGRAAAVRAVGVALKRNPFPLLVPCHRVLRAGGQLGGYSAGPGVKRRLLAIEAGQEELDLGAGGSPAGEGRPAEEAE
jgi:methylated-DNA-[protein]-cysteine S-methyltransferase